MFQQPNLPPLPTEFQSKHTPTSPTSFRNTLRSARMSPYHTFYSMAETEPTQHTINCDNCEKCQHLKRMKELEKACKKFDANYLKDTYGVSDEKGKQRGKSIGKSNGFRERSPSATGFSLYAENNHLNHRNRQNPQMIPTSPSHAKNLQSTADGRFAYDYKIDQGSGSRYPIQTFTLYQIPVSSHSQYHPSPKPQHHPHSYTQRHNFQKVPDRQIDSSYDNLLDKIAFVQATNQQSLADTIREILRSQKVNELSSARNQELRGMVESLSQKQNQIHNFMERMERDKESVFERGVNRQLEEFRERERGILKEFEKLKGKEEEKEHEREIEVEKRVRREREIEQEFLKQKKTVSQAETQQIHQQHKANKQLQEQKQTETRALIQNEIQRQLQHQRGIFKQKEVEWNKQLQQQELIQQQNLMQMESQRQRINQIEIQRQREWESRKGIQRQNGNELMRQREMAVRNEMMRALEVERQRTQEQMIVREQERQVAEKRQRELMMVIESQREQRRHLRGENQNSSLIELSSEGQDITHHHRRREHNQPPNPSHPIQSNFRGPYQPLSPSPHSRSQHTQSHPLIKRTYQDIEQQLQISFQSNDSSEFKQKIKYLFSQAQLCNQQLARHSNQFDLGSYQKLEQLVRLRNESVNDGLGYLNNLNKLINQVEHIPEIQSRVRVQVERRRG